MSRYCSLLTTRLAYEHKIIKHHTHARARTHTFHLNINNNSHTETKVVHKNAKTGTLIIILVNRFAYQALEKLKARAFILHLYLL